MISVPLFDGAYFADVWWLVMIVCGLVLINCLICFACCVVVCVWCFSWSCC